MHIRGCSRTTTCLLYTTQGLALLQLLGCVLSSKSLLRLRQGCSPMSRERSSDESPFGKEAATLSDDPELPRLRKA